MKFSLFTDISAIHTFSEFAASDGVFPAKARNPIIENAAILVAHRPQGSRIVWLGPKSRATQTDLKKLANSMGAKAAIKRVSLKGAVVMPSFHECHTHLLYSGDRSDEFERRNRGETYLQIAQAGGGIRSTIRATKAAKPNALFEQIIQRLFEFTYQGVTTVEIKSGYAATIEDELSHLKLLLKVRSWARKNAKAPRVILTCLAAHSVPDGFSEDIWLEKIEKEIFPFLKANKIRVDVFIEKSAFSLERAKLHFERAKALGLEFTIHADQISRTGAATLGVELGARSVDHVIESNSQDIAKVANSQTVAVFLPAADLYTRLPYPPARKFLDAGARVALATDHNPGSSPGLDISLVGVLARVNMQMTLSEVLCAYTYNAARALGLQSSLGALTVGRSADFICLKPGTLLTELFYELGPARSSSRIESVWRDGLRIK